MSEPYIDDMNPSDAAIDAKALDAFRSSPPAFLTVPAKRK